MKKYVIITCSLLAFLVFCSKSCETQEDEQAAKKEIAFQATLDTINSSFLNDNLSEQMLRSFEIKAKQKLVDFADYLKIFSDKSLDESFKEQSRQMILDLFISDTVHIILKVPDEKNEKKLALNEFIKTDFSPGINSIVYIFDSIEISEPLHRMNDLNYTGSLKFSESYEMSSATNSAITGSVSKKVDIIATKIGKQFGSDTLKIWKVFLGDIR